MGVVCRILELVWDQLMHNHIATQINLRSGSTQSSTPVPFHFKVITSDESNRISYDPGDSSFLLPHSAAFRCVC